MALICDTGGVYALYDADDDHHSAVKEIVAAESGPLLLPVVLLAEIDYLLSTRLGPEASVDFLKSIEQSAFTLVPFLEEDVTRCRELLQQYNDLSLGLADASVIAVVERLAIQRVLTVDERHFRAVKTRKFTHLTLLPADAT